MKSLHLLKNGDYNEARSIHHPLTIADSRPAMFHLILLLCNSNRVLKAISRESIIYITTIAVRKAKDTFKLQNHTMVTKI